MNFLRDRWQRTPLHRYFADMEPGDRGTALIVLALLTAWAFAFAGIVRHHEPALSSQPPLPTRPFAMDFAAAHP